MEASTDYFISLIESNRIIYDKSSKDFKNTPKKEEAWVRIARNSRMTVADAKKRYTSLRQKYCREKQKIEVQRRTKSNPLKPWTFYDRLHFLDEYIRPRTTYTNDTGFEEVDGNSYHRFDDANMSLAEEHAMMHGNGLESEIFKDEIGESNLDRSDGVIRYNTDDIQDHNSIRIIHVSEDVPTAILSEYSGELSTHVPALQDDESETDDSPRPATNHNFPGPSHGNDYCESSLGDDLGATSQGNDFIGPSRVNDFSGVRRNESSTESTNVLNRKRANNVPARVIRQNVEPLATTTGASTISNVPSMDSVRYKLDSCLTSLSTKISENRQRSPHAPFLAYLSTKLPNVPNDKLQTLEKQILNLVDSFIV